MRRREQRHKVLLRARLKSGDGWHDACILDLSRRGAGLQAASAPARGSYVDIRRGLHVVVARVVWSRGHRFGIAAQDDLPIHAIANDRSPPTATAAVRGGDRRQLPRPPAERAESSRRFGQRLQFVLAIAAGMGAATIAGAEVRQALAAPLAKVGSALGD